MNFISRDEKQFFVKATVLALCVANLPYVYGYFTAPRGSAFAGFSTLNSEDFNLYLSFIQQAARGKIFFCNLYTSESLSCTLLLPFFLAIGKLAGALHAPVVYVVHGVRLFCSFALCLAAFSLFRLIIDDGKQRNLAFALLLFSSGFGGYLYLFRVISPDTARLPMEIGLNPSNTMMTMLFTIPVYALAQALMLSAFCVVIVNHTLLPRWRPLYSFLAGLISGILVLVHPYDVFISFIVCLYVVFATVKQGRGLRGALVSLLIYAMTIFPFGMVHVMNFMNNPFVRNWADVDRMVTYSFVEIFSAYGFLSIFVLTGIRSAYVERRRTFVFPVMWLGAALALSRIPFIFPDRMLNGFHVPVCILASQGMVAAQRKLEGLLSEARAQRVIRVVVILSAFTTICVLVNDLRGLSERSFPYYMPARYDEAFTWLRENTAGTDVVLSSYAVGNFIPVRSGRRVFAGHSDATMYRMRKMKQLRVFFSMGADERWRQNLCKRHGVTYIFYSAEENRIGPYNPEQSRWLKKVFDNGTIRIFKVAF